MNSNASAISLKNVKKNFGSFTALHSIDITIEDNEFFTLLGPSGCGKTTLLRMIAGFEAISSGEIFLYGDEIEALPPDKRSVNTVFQHYALFPHMTVAQNIGFGLKMLRWPVSDIDERIEEMISLVRLQEFAHRKPAQLSGGQQQRVALARAMAPRPKVLLLDEPLSALDLKLRQQMRSELKELQRTTGITFVFVTHDQEEALSMSDRIAVMSAGRIQQIGTPEAIYETPCNQFVADFIGDTNLLEASVCGQTDTGLIVQLSTGDSLSIKTASQHPVNTTGMVSIRPERFSISHKENYHEKKTTGSTDNFLTGTIGQVTYLGTDRQYEVNLSNQLDIRVQLQSSDKNALHFQAGQKVNLIADPAAISFLTS